MATSITTRNAVGSEAQAAAVVVRPAARQPLPWREARVRDVPVHELFRQAARENLNHTALLSDAGSLTYRELLERSEQLAARLRKQSIGRGSLVGLATGRSFSTVVAILGTLMAGAAYVPFDIKGAPAGLLERQASASNLALLLFDESFAQIEWEFAWWGNCPLRRLGDLDSPLAPGTAPASSADLSAAVSAVDPVSIMYTSGSIGQPKGVIVPHRGVVRLISGQSYLEFGPEETFLLHSPLSFDASTLELWGGLLHGGQVAIAPQRTLSVDDYFTLVGRFGVTTLWLSAPVFHLVADHKPETFAPLRNLLVGGDVVSPERVEKIATLFPRLNLINGYGPTENTTFTTCYRVPRGYRAAGSLPIGREIAGTRVYLLDERMQPVADGQPGQLVAAGDGVALGYLAAQDATAARFLPDPYATTSAEENGSQPAQSDQRQATMYLTGDKARRLPDGNLEFLGRLDREVKVLGQRVDLGEVEEALSAHPLVCQSAVLTADAAGAEKRIHAFVELRRAEPEAARILREHLAARLPEAALPSRLVLLPQMPLSVSGKIDRAALTGLMTEEAAGSQDAGASRNPLADVQAIWERLLRTTEIDTEENFFDAGGNSLLLVQMHAELNRIYPGSLTLMDLFSFTTITQISDRLIECASGREICGGNTAANGPMGGANDTHNDTSIR